MHWGRGQSWRGLGDGHCHEMREETKSEKRTMFDYLIWTGFVVQRLEWWSNVCNRVDAES
jgi:hypothetical protein